MYESILSLIVALFNVASTPLISSSTSADAMPLQGVVSRTMPTNEQQLAHKPFLTLPFKQTDAPRGKLAVNEGWYYSPEEMAVHDKPLHRGIDWPRKRETPVVAAADGYAVRSFQLADTEETYKGKKVGFSLGEFVEIWHPKQKLYTMYAHLQKADDGVPYVTTEQLSETTWEPTGIYVRSAEFMQKAVEVKRGQVIGYVGDSGIGWGYSDSFNTNTKHVNERNANTLPSWDETHLHFEVYSRTSDGRYKDERFDPFGLYDFITSTRNPYGKTLLEANTLWLSNNQGQPLYADEYR